MMRVASRPLGEDPAVLTWRIALAPRRPYRVGRHWWREFITDAWRSADHAWWLDRENVATGYATEMREYAEAHPRPKLRDFMVHLSTGALAPERLDEAS